MCKCLNHARIPGPLFTLLEALVSSPACYSCRKIVVLQSVIVLRCRHFCLPPLVRRSGFLPVFFNDSTTCGEMGFVLGSAFIGVSQSWKVRFLERQCGQSESCKLFASPPGPALIFPPRCRRRFSVLAEVGPAGLRTRPRPSVSRRARWWAPFASSWAPSCSHTGRARVPFTTWCSRFGCGVRAPLRWGLSSSASGTFLWAFDGDVRCTATSGAQNKKLKEKK